ncbi:MAG: nicotinamide mononucleotide transporter [Ruminiclostridium sp.]|nr:nicotinamide mononucleotide transporter [Ruminiclostridium sp.]
MKISNPFRDLTEFERRLWIISMGMVLLSFLFSGGGYLEAAASLVGVTALIFVAKGYVTGQVLTVVFSVLYGIISFFSQYYGEMITYLCMTAPMAVMSIISWARHPYKDSKEVEVSHLSPKKIIVMIILTAIVTAVFYFVLKALHNASLIISTISVATSFIAVYLTFLRSPYYALGYAANDIVLIILWIIAGIEDISRLPMVMCFIMFLVNDLYGFYNWRKMRNRQEST